MQLTTPGMITINIRFGATNELTKELPEGTTVAALLANQSVKVGLGFGDNVQAVVNGSILSGSTVLDDGDAVTIESKANSKAAAATSAK